MNQDNLSLRKAKSYTTLGAGSRTSMYITNPPLSNKKLGGFGRVLSIFGRKKDSISSDGRSSERASFMDVMDVDSTYDQQGDSDGEVSRLDEVIDENSTSDAFKVYHSLLDSDFKELHKKEVDLRTNLLREDKVKLLEQKETNLESRLKELELRQIQLVSEQLKGQLKELQIRELKLLEKKVNKEKEEEEKERRRQMSIESEKGYEKDTLIRVLGSRSKSNSPKPDMNKSLPVISPVLQSENVVVKVEANRDKSLPDIVQDKSLLETKLNSIDSIREDDDEGGDILPTSKNTEERWTSDTTGLGIDILSSSGLREPRLDYVTSSSSILNRSGSGNKFGNLHAFQNESFEDLPEPQIYDTPDESFGSDNPLNVLNDTLQTFTSEGGKFDVFHPRSRILSESSGKAGSSKSDNSEATKTNTIAVGVSTSTPISKSVVTIPIPSTTPISSNTISNISFSSTESRKKKRENRTNKLIYPFQKKDKRDYIKIKIYNHLQDTKEGEDDDDDDEIIAMKIAKEEITNIQLLVDAICSKAIGSSDIDPNQVKLSLVSKNSREKAVQLTSTGARLRSELIMDYVYGRDKIFVEAVIQPSVVSYMK